MTSGDALDSVLQNPADAPPVSQPQRRRTITRHVALLLLLATLPNAAIISLACIAGSLQHHSHKVLQGMLANTRVIQTASDLVNELQEERLAKAISPWIADFKRDGEDGAASARDTDAALAAFDQALSLGAIDADCVELARRKLAELSQIRKIAVCLPSAGWQSAFAGYTELIDTVVGATHSTIEGRTDRGMGRVFGKISHIQRAQESVSRLPILLLVQRERATPAPPSEKMEIARNAVIAAEVLDSPLVELGMGSRRLCDALRSSPAWQNLSHWAAAATTGAADLRDMNPVHLLTEAEQVRKSILGIARDETADLASRVAEQEAVDRTRQLWMYCWTVVGMLSVLATAVLIGLNFSAARKLAVSHAELVTALDRLGQTGNALQEANKSLAEACEEAESANRSKSQFLANMSHELRSPLHGILNYAAFGVKKIDTAGRDKLLHYYRQIEQSGKVLLALVSDLLDLARLEAGKVRFDFAPVDLRHAICAVLDEFAPLLAERKLAVDASRASESVIVQADRDKLAQVLRNLLSNACKFSAENTSIDIEVEPDKQGVTVSVYDRGVGIPENELETIFDQFVQSSKTRTGAGGTGLGLSICRQIVAGHRGRIWSENRPGGGSVLRFRIPRDPTRASETPSADTIVSAPIPVIGNPVPGTRGGSAVGCGT